MAAIKESEMTKREKPSWCIFESRPAIYTPGEAWCFGRSARHYVKPHRKWERVHSTVVMMEGTVWSSRFGKVTRRKIGKWFGRIPPLPREAFAST